MHPALKTALKAIAAVFILLVFSTLIAAGFLYNHFSQEKAVFKDRAELFQASSNVVVDASIEFNNKLRARFPEEMQQDELIEKLKELGFSISAYAATDAARKSVRYGVYQIHVFPCLHSWNVVWINDGEKATHIQGTYNPTCL